MPSRHRRSRVWAERLVIVAFLALVAGLIAWKADDIAWDQVMRTLRGYDRVSLGLAALIAGTSTLVYCGYDLLARAYVQHRLTRLRVMAIAFVSYAFNLNLGAFVGGVGFRYRLYSRAGLKQGAIARVVSFSLATNWLGHFLLAGGVLLLRQVPLPESWGVAAGVGQLIGAGLLSVVGLYLWLSAFSRRRSVRIRGHEILFPGWRMALLQLLVSAANWTLMAGILFVLLHEHVAFGAVLSTLLIAAIAGVITHVPGGIGVIEFVFIGALGGKVGHGELIAAILAYRAFLYLGPLVVALALYVALEAAGRSPQPAHA